MELIYLLTTRSASLSMPTVALKGLVVFPGMSINFDVGREKSIAALKTKRCFSLHKSI